MVKESKKPKKKVEGLWMRNQILNIWELNDSEKILLAHFDSFGDKGCYQSNETLAKLFMTTPRTIRKRIAKIRAGDFIYIKSPKGYYRTIWVKTNPEVMAAVKLWYREKQIDKPREGGRKLPTKVEKSCLPSRKKDVFRRGKNLPTTNTEIYTETKKETMATPLPLPAGGEAPALLEDRKAGVLSEVEQLKRNFGNNVGRRKPGLTEAEFEQRKQAQLKALEAVEIGQKGG
jgi:hypothetical protein